MGSMTIEIKNNLGKDVDASFVDGKICLNWAETKRKLGDLNPGDVFKGKSETEYIVCGHEHFVTYVVRRELLDEKMKFGDTNNWVKSNIRKYLNEDYVQVIEREFGNGNIVAFERDLISLDGYNDYATCVDKVSVMNVMEYVKYHKYVGNCDFRYVLITPDSTPSGCSANGVRYVVDDGRVGCSWCSGGFGVRPFFVLKSSTFVS
jgi:hypothetical protein|uniref:Uncharacterized protein n=1 Tax=Siphoviridae sp. ctL0q1 TaxID=2825449 RepID=A0A8S5PJ10_9CAUD|nr:MAG TPA: hypothetical protein [Siphoviridae sp. ctL0q1]